ncbi:MAG: phosphatase PAP2 family protein [Pyrinomonadaceae bacterium]
MKREQTDDKRLIEVLSLSLVAALLAAVGALVFLAWLADEVLEGETRPFDDATRQAIHEWASPTLTTVMRDVSFLGSSWFLFGLTAVSVALLLMLRAKRQAMLLAITMGGSSLLDVTLKHAFQRPRPIPFFNLPAPNSYSFPSGHALASFCFYAGFAALLTARLARRQAIAMWTAAVLLVFSIGFSRIYLGVHYITDVVAGYLAALIWIVAVRFVDLELSRRKKRKRGLKDHAKH